MDRKIRAAFIWNTFCNIINIFTVTFDKFNASLLKIQTIEWRAPMQFQLQIRQHGKNYICIIAISCNHLIDFLMHEVTQWEMWDLKASHTPSFHRLLKLTNPTSQIFAVESRLSAERALLKPDLSWFSWEARNGPIIIIIFRSVSTAPRLIHRLLLSLLSFHQGSSAISLGHLHASISLSGACRFLGSRRSFIKIVRRQNTAAYSSMSFSHKTRGRFDLVITHMWRRPSVGQSERA